MSLPPKKHVFKTKHYLYKIRTALLSTEILGNTNNTSSGKQVSFTFQPLKICVFHDMLY